MWKKAQSYNVEESFKDYCIRIQRPVTSHWSYLEYKYKTAKPYTVYRTNRKEERYDREKRLVLKRFRKTALELR